MKLEQWKLAQLSKFFLSGVFLRPKFFALWIYSHLFHTVGDSVHKLTDEDLLEDLKGGKSLIRFGDGEALILTGRDIYFQPSYRALRKSLMECVQAYSDSSPYLLGIAIQCLETPSSDLSKREQGIWRLYRNMYSAYFKKNVRYFDAFKFYNPNFFRDVVQPVFINRHIVCVSNESTLKPQLVKYPERSFFSVSFVVASSHDSFRFYNVIKARVLGLISEQSHLTPLVLSAVGPAGKVLAYDLSLQGIQSIDLGHGFSRIF